MKPACNHYRKCSGCTKLQFPYAKQLRDKTTVVRERLARFASGRAVEAVVDEIVPSPLELGYRTSTKLCLSEDAFGRRAIGLYERQSKTVVAIPGCPVQNGVVNRVIERLFKDERAIPAPFYNHTKRGFQPGRLKFVTVRHSPQTGETGVILSHTGVEKLALEEWIAGLRLDGIAVYASELRREDEDRVLSFSSEHVAGPETIRYRLGETEFALTPDAFFQANASLSDAFVERVVDLAVEPRPGATLIDLYGGFGSYAFAAAKRFERVHLVDANKPAIEAARVTAKATGTKHLTAFHATSEEYLAKLKPADAKAVTHIIVNPPRGGLSPKVKESLGRTKFPSLRELVYVSCDVSTLTRDLADLRRLHGARLERATPFDMFPQTDHIETVARLSFPAAPKDASRRPQPARKVSRNRSRTR